MYTKLGQAALATSILLGLAASASAQTERSARATESRAVGICEGFAQEYANARTQNSVVSTSSTIFVEIPTTRISGGASGDIDLYTVTFSGQTSATGGGSIEVQAQVSINGEPFIPMSPNEPDTFHSGNPAQTHTMTWCREISGTPVFRVVWRKVGGGAAILDDYLMRVERSN